MFGSTGVHSVQRGSTCLCVWNRSSDHISCCTARDIIMDVSESSGYCPEVCTHYRRDPVHTQPTHCLGHQPWYTRARIWPHGCQPPAAQAAAPKVRQASATARCTTPCKRAAGSPRCSGIRVAVCSTHVLCIPPTPPRPRVMTNAGFGVSIVRIRSRIHYLRPRGLV